MIGDANEGRSRLCRLFSIASKKVSRHHECDSYSLPVGIGLGVLTGLLDFERTRRDTCARTRSLT